MNMYRSPNLGQTFGTLARTLLIMSLLIAPLASVSATGSTVPVAQTAQAGGLPFTTLYSDVLGHPTADVPGLPGAHFSSFDKPFGSANGNWILSADTDLDTAEDEIIIVNNVVKAREGTPALWTIGENVGLIDQRLGINDNGEWVFATNTDGLTTADDYIVKVSATDVFTAAAKEGDPIPALPGATWDDLLDTAVIATDGSAGLSGDGIDGVPTTEDEILVLGNTILAHEGIITPTGQIGNDAWENFDLDGFWISADGSQWIAQGDLAGDTNFDDVIVVDGTVVVQEGVVLSGTAFTDPVDLNGILDIHMARNGDWYVRGNNDVSEQDWIYSNNGLLATTGDPIHIGASEIFTDAEFSDCFFLHVGDSFGNYILGGVSNGQTDFNGVIVLNNTHVIVREGDPIDLNNNGMFDEDLYYNTFGNDDGYLSDAGIYYFVATMKDGLGAAAGDVFMSVDISSLIGGGGNTPPDLSNVTAASPVNENSSTTLSGTISDPDTGDTFTLVTDWGDGTVMTYTYSAGTTAFTETHAYLDDDPTGTPSDMYSISLTLTDSADGQDTDSTSVTVDNVAPALSNVSAAPVNENQQTTLTGEIADPGTLDTFTLVTNWGDGTVMTYTYGAGTTVFSETHTYPDGLLLPMDTQYTVTLTLTDDDTGQDTATTSASVNNVAPSISVMAASGPIEENETTTLTGVFFDPGAQDSFTILVDWGDGSTLTATLPAGATDFLHTHQYLDDEPSGTASDLYTITVTITDDDGDSGMATAPLTVTNVAPTAIAGLDQEVDDGTTVNFTGSYTDPGTLDTHTILWDFGDGITATGSLTTSHLYDGPGVYTVTLTITDDDGGVSQDTLQVTVNEVIIEEEFTLYLPIIHK